VSRRRKPMRVLALPVVENDDVLLAEHRRLLSAGYTLAEYLRVRIDRRRMKAECRAAWHKPAPASRPNVQVTLEHVWTVDLSKGAR